LHLLYTAESLNTLSIQGALLPWLGLCPWTQLGWSPRSYYRLGLCEPWASTIPRKFMPWLCHKNMDNNLAVICSYHTVLMVISQIYLS